MNHFRCILTLALALAAASAGAAPLRDPFARPPAPAPAPAAAAAEAEAEAERAPAPRLRAIMYEPRHSLANIGGQIVAVGDWYGNYRVVAIEERSVTLLRNKAKSVLVLDNESSK